MRSEGMSLHDFAVSRLRALFPSSAMVAEIDRKLRLAAVAALGGRCLERGCVFRAFQDGRCRQHFADLHAQYSVTPSSLVDVIAPDSSSSERNRRWRRERHRRQAPPRGHQGNEPRATTARAHASA
jgi:hypothetical protein